MTWKSWAAAAFALCAACSASTRTNLRPGSQGASASAAGAGGGAATGAVGTTSAASGTGGGISLGPAGSGGSGGQSADDCTDAAKLVYVTGVGDQLWSFYPPKLQFTLIGKFDCLTNPTHMTVDRQAVAWVVAGGKVYQASTKDAKCSAAPKWAPQAQFADFALTFVGTMAVDHSLYLMGSQQLGKFDTVSGNVTVVGNAPGPFVNGDMTSNGDGTLYFLWDEATPALYDIDPKNGAILSQSPLAAAGGGDQALAFWGGSFWAFENNTIYEYDPKAKTTAAKGMAPLSVTGAGQSTCVPKIPPPPM